MRNTNELSHDMGKGSVVGVASPVASTDPSTGSEEEETIGQFQCWTLVEALTHQEGQLVGILTHIIYYI